MCTVRDEDGFTYNIRSSHSWHTYCGGHWLIKASFDPTFFQEGYDAIMVQLKKWVDQGSTIKDDLASKKTDLTGSFKVAMAATEGLAAVILSFAERGLEPGHIDQYSK